ncbi:MAG: mannitol dehydrogenase family protein [Clostridiaceae bacterium]|nr:mannitol dehydrogenase family protein [Clostridiaceae bacterium]
MKLNLNSIKNREQWEERGFHLPKYDIELLRAETKANPRWLHFGPGNLFRMFIARVQDELLDRGLTDTGVIVVESFNADSLDHIFRPHDNLSTAVTLKSDGALDLRVVGCIAETLKAIQNHEDWQRLTEIFSQDSLEYISCTITEKGYNLLNHNGDYTPAVQSEMQDPEMYTSNAMGIICLLLYQRYLAGQYPLTLLSFDNVSHNGSLFRKAVLAYAEAWTGQGYLEPEFYEYLKDEKKIRFPWSMIDKITPGADSSVAQMLKDRGYEDVEGALLDGKPLAPSFVNGEETEYLVIEDSFVNGKPDWNHGGIIFTDRETVDLAETMKVTTCLNPLHTALAIYGSLLGISKINQAVQDKDLLNLIKGVGYKEGLPVVVDPGILDPQKFLDTVIEERFPNPFLPDTTQRIATDTSQKIPVRFGNTLKAYAGDKPELIKDLTFIPAVLAGWLRYLLAVDDRGNQMELSPDPMLASLQAALAEITFGDNSNSEEILRPILQNEKIFGLNLAGIALDKKIISYFKFMNAGTGRVRALLENLERV